MLYFIDKVDCEILQPTGKNEFDTPFNTKALSSQEPDQRLFQAALAAMQGMMASGLCVGSMAFDAWELAEALINEGKKRGKL